MFNSLPPGFTCHNLTNPFLVRRARLLRVQANAGRLRSAKAHH